MCTGRFFCSWTLSIIHTYLQWWHTHTSLRTCMYTDIPDMCDVCTHHVHMHLHMCKHIVCMYILYTHTGMYKNALYECILYNVRNFCNLPKFVKFLLRKMFSLNGTRLVLNKIAKILTAQSFILKKIMKFSSVNFLLYGMPKLYATHVHTWAYVHTPLAGGPAVWASRTREDNLSSHHCQTGWLQCHRDERQVQHTPTAELAMP